METLGRKKKWVTYKAFLTDHNMATHKPSSTVSDQMTFCEGGGVEVGDNR